MTKSSGGGVDVYSHQGAALDEYRTGHVRPRGSRRDESCRSTDSSCQVRTNGSRPPITTPAVGGPFSYWQFPTGPSKAPNASSLNPSNGDVVNAASQPLSSYSPQGPAGSGGGSGARAARPGVVPAPGERQYMQQRESARPFHQALSVELPGKPEHGRPNSDPLAVGNLRSGTQCGRVDRHDRALSGAEDQAAAARRDRQRTSVPTVDLGDRPFGAAKRRLLALLSVVGLPRRIHRGLILKTKRVANRKDHQ